VRFCMITTFFGPQSFGGDAAYVDRLSRSLARRGHEVDVVHDADAFQAVRGGAPLRRWAPFPAGVTVRTLSSRAGRLAPLWTHQTGGPGLRSPQLARILSEGNFDVVHFHNISLLGGPGVLGMNGGSARPVRLMSLHDYWLVCPMHLLWKLQKRVCDGPQCVRCTLNGMRPPQLWRRTERLQRALRKVDALISPSSYCAELHRARGVPVPVIELPYHLPRDWAAGSGGRFAASPGRPYFAAAGRLVDEKGFGRLIELMGRLPDVDLKLAGAGPREVPFQSLAEQLPNVELVGLLPSSELAALLEGARGFVAPSLFPETFGYSVAEALSVGTPALVPRRGALPELIRTTGGGVVYDTEAELEAAMRRLATDDSLRNELGARGRAGAEAILDEGTHLERYLGLIADVRSGRPARSNRSAESLDEIATGGRAL
jgi:glycosyltransferase involved in cell wall biosynthesis